MFVVLLQPLRCESVQHQYTSVSPRPPLMVQSITGAGHRLRLIVPLRKTPAGVAHCGTIQTVVGPPDLVTTINTTGLEWIQYGINVPINSGNNWRDFPLTIQRRCHHLALVALCCGALVTGRWLIVLQTRSCSLRNVRANVEESCCVVVTNKVLLSTKYFLLLKRRSSKTLHEGGMSERV